METEEGGDKGEARRLRDFVDVDDLTDGWKGVSCVIVEGGRNQVDVKMCPNDEAKYIWLEKMLKTKK
jgi:hypothetical protein